MPESRGFLAALAVSALLLGGCQRYPAPIKTLRFVGACLGHVGDLAVDGVLESLVPSEETELREKMEKERKEAQEAERREWNAHCRYNIANPQPRFDRDGNRID